MDATTANGEKVLTGPRFADGPVRDNEGSRRRFRQRQVWR